VHVRITEESHEAWRTFCRENGVTIGSVIEAMGERLASGKPLHEEGVAIVIRAREIDERHRSRRAED
jgi:hypothetical protein